MVTIADGRFELPEHLHYSKNQHIYIDMEKKLIGLDQIGFAFLKNPSELKILADNDVKIGEPFATITTKSGITVLNSPCNGKIKNKNPNALKFMENDTYGAGYILELEEITGLDKNNLITGENVEKWAMNEVKCLIQNYYSFKIILIGDSAAGKTAIKVRFTDDYFKKDLRTTLGVDFGSKEVKYEYVSDDVMFAGAIRITIRINIWDAAGQTHFEKIRGMYYRDSKGAILVYDISNPVSFQNLDLWVKELEENVGSKIPVLLIANKLDLERKVSFEDGLAYAKKHGFLFTEASAKTGEGVKEAFQRLAIEIYKKEENIK